MECGQRRTGRRIPNTPGSSEACESRIFMWLVIPARCSRWRKAESSRPSFSGTERRIAEEMRDQRKIQMQNTVRNPQSQMLIITEPSAWRALLEDAVVTTAARVSGRGLVNG